MMIGAIQLILTMITILIISQGELLFEGFRLATKETLLAEGALIEEALIEEEAAKGRRKLQQERKRNKNNEFFDRQAQQDGPYTRKRTNTQYQKPTNSNTDEAANVDDENLTDKRSDGG